MKKILVLLSGFASLACAMDVPQNLNPMPDSGPENIYANLKFKNNTNHNLVIINNATNEIVTGLKPNEIKDKKDMHISFAGEPAIEKERNQGQFWIGSSRIGQTYYRIDAIKNGEASTLGFLLISADAHNLGAVEATDKNFISLALQSKSQTDQIGVEPTYIDNDNDNIEITSGKGLTGNERIDIDAQIVLEGDDLGQSKIEDLTAVIH